MVQEEEQRKHERRVKEYIGVDDIGECTEGEWAYYGNDIKRCAPYMLKPQSFQDLKVVIDWLRERFVDDSSVLYSLSEIAQIIRGALNVHPWGLLSNAERKSKVKAIIDAVEELEDLLQDSELPPLPPAAWFLESSRAMWRNRSVGRVTRKWCKDNQAHHPEDLGLGDFFASLKKHIEGNLQLKVADSRPNTGSVNARILARRLSESMRYVFQLDRSPNVQIASLVNMVYPELSVTAEKVQEWTKKKHYVTF